MVPRNRRFRGLLPGALELRSIPFWKLQAIGNDFPLFHATDLAGVDLPKLAIAAADRKFGIGGDGILVAQPVDRHRIELRMFNPDGTEDFCGNGLRIAVRHAFDQGWVEPKFAISHLNRVVDAVVSQDGSIRTTIGSASYNPEDVPVDSSDGIFDRSIATIDGEAIIGSALTTGSTHLIIPVIELPDDQKIERLGPELEYLPIFPDRTSVIFCRTTDLNEIQIRIWERGVGETLGCGTGSSAAAADYLRREGRGGTVLVRNPGGAIRVSMEAWNAPITVEGTAEAVYSGSFLFAG
jgi:diaminopimelate epimerase